VLELRNRVDSLRHPGILETLVMYVSLLIHYDPEQLPWEELTTLCASLLADEGTMEDLEWPSRLLEIPVCYADPWTRECVLDYCKKIKPIEGNPELVVRVNGLGSVDDLVRIHSSTQHWVGGVGFWPGLPDLAPLDPRSRLSVPKYDPPRLWTPVGAVGVGGGFSSIYSMNTPGGYQLIGRTPVPIFDLGQRFDVFRQSPVLFRPGDRVKFLPITPDEFERIQARVDRGTYVYNVVEYEVFSLRRYETWLSRIDWNRRF
jgi:urea carboxylase